jgi:superfamily II DNA or RNA helicase
MNQVCKEILGNPTRQILILSDRKQHLEDMFKMAQESGINSVGYYVGGMKKEKLKENESCKLLLGTFPMANEGLDIPSLNGLVLSTPKSDIIQSVGRICRMKHENIDPMIIDIVDKFSIFENQSRKRFNVYKKKKYDIEDISYNLDTSTITMTKGYFFHNCFGDEESNSDKEDLDKEDVIEIDTEYNDINPKTNKRGKKIIKNEVKPKGDDFDKLFNSISMFS